MRRSFFPFPKTYHHRKNKMTKLRKHVVKIVALVGAASFTLGACSANEVRPNTLEHSEDKASYVQKANGSIKTNQEDFYDKNVVYKLPETVEQNQDISVIVTMNTETVVDAYKAKDTTETLSDYVASGEAKRIATEATRAQSRLIDQLRNSGVNYTLGEKYDTILNGFEITVKARDFEKVNRLFATQATLIVGETYAPAKTEIVHNDVDVYDTGIFDSSSSEYQGDGVVVAVLDTGLDYTHTAFDVNNFTTSKEAFTLQSVSQKVGQTTAAKTTAGLTGQDVYVSKKVPYAYDYADKDPDVLPINSEHGTHVAGVIAGKDDVITGVAPNAQLAIMKVFSDTQEGAKTSWLLAALEDCVTLGVDVINMSLGSGCGFSREVDKENVNKVYDSIRDAGISLIASAANSYNATFGSEKNGSLGLTSNPDSGTVGSPSTYAAALSVASVDGVKTPYLRYNEDIIYFNEASTASAETKDFVDDILKTLGDNVTEHDFEYVTIPGVGASSDYPEGSEFYEGKIVLVKRGQTTFEDKVRVALKEKGAAGIIIYNNVSGIISMSVGANVGAVCSISQDEGEMLAKAGTGIIKISKSQVAGPFMSDFSSWGPTSDLKIKPEITAHGGEILSSVPGQDYDRQSGTSMAAPNQAGATALIRQYVKYSGVFGDPTAQEVTGLVNQLMMSTADIVYNKNGLPYAVRKQGAGLVNITKASTTAAYVTTYENGAAMDKTKLELGDDKKRTGVYEMTFDINNISNSNVVYDIGSIVMTEGVSETYTSHGDTTVTQDGYLLNGATTSVTAVTGGTKSGNAVTVGAKQTAKVTVKIALSAEDKKYLEDSFQYGMYVEGFVTFKATAGTSVNMNVPMLAFYGDWTEAPIFDEEYYDTHKDEINAGIDAEDKLMADAYATRVIGGLYSDYIATLGTYYFDQDPAATQIAADKDHIAISNHEDDKNSAVTAIRSISAGLLRNAKEVQISIVEDATGKEIFNRTENNQHKSYSSGNTVYASSIDVEFAALEHNLKNNTKYTVTVTAYIDYGAKEDQKNVRNTFEFPLYIDFQAPAVTNVTYRTEYDRTTKKTKLFADLDIYDNHYAMGVQIGQIKPAEENSDYTFMMSTFGKYITPVYSSYNSTSKVTIELTDYISELKKSAGLAHDGGNSVEYNNNSFIAICYDYAMNSATYEIRLPDEILSLAFTENELRLNPNETKDISTILNVFPAESWLQVLDFESSNDKIVDVVNQTIIAKKSGTATITAIGKDANGNEKTATLSVKVLAEGEDGWNEKGYTIPEVNKFTLTGYTVNKAYYSVSSEEREIGLTDGTYDFDGDYNLSMFPSESVTLLHQLDSYFPDRADVTYSSMNSKIATVSPKGEIVALKEGKTIINVTVTFDKKPTLYSGRVSITVKDPFITNSIYLMNYKGLGGTVEIPADRGVTTIYSYAFSNYEFVDKDLAAGDVIDEEDPYLIKQMYIGEDTITKVVIPEGVTTIEAYAFAKLTALEEVVLPSTLTRIAIGAFYGCEKLKTINLENVKFINERVFSGCALEEIDLSSVVAIGNYTFENCKLNYVELPKSSQSLGIGAFYANKNLTSVDFKASKIKIGSYAFAECSQLIDMDINAAVIASYAFYNCSNLTDVKLGKDVAVIGEYAFAGTNVAKFTKDAKNTLLTLEEDGAIVLNGEELVLVAPRYSDTKLTTSATSIATGAFSGNTKILRVSANEVTYVGPYAFADCKNLELVEMDNVEVIDDYAFYGTALKATPNLERVTQIGDYAFAGTLNDEGEVVPNNITAVTIADDTVIGRGAFYLCTKLQSVTIGDDVTVGDAAFYAPVLLYTYENTQIINNANYTEYTYKVMDGTTVVETYSYYRYNFDLGVISNLTSLTIGTNATLGDLAFSGHAKLTDVTLGAGVTIGAQAFYNAAALKNIDLSEAKAVGEYAFSGTRTRDYCYYNNVWVEAFVREYIDGETVITDYMYTTFAPRLTTVDLTSATEIGAGAFVFNDALQTVTLGGEITTIEAETFGLCTGLTQIVLPAQITTIGDYAFFGTSLNTVDLSGVNAIGEYAFGKTPLTEVTLKAGATIGEGAFDGCDSLAKVENLDKATEIGAYAFFGTALEEVQLTEATFVGDYAFGESAIINVTLGEKLTELGENPFYACAIETFGGETETYDVNDTLKVIDGALYQIVPKGLELISYPAACPTADFTVADGTVRIGAKAFAGSAIESVTIPYTLKALGDKAFYDCGELSVVIFKGYNAPILEEEYEPIRAMTYENLPFTGKMGEYEGLGIVPFYMWNITTSPNNFYYGANFVDYIGHVSEHLVLVKPANGQGYDTFIFSQYFSKTVEGVNAATEATLRTIALIEAIPATITLECGEAITAARNAYNMLSLEQQALVTNYATLTKAESAFSRLAPSTPSNPETPVVNDKKTEESGFAKFMKNNAVGLIIALVVALGAAAYIVVDKVVLKKKKATSGNAAASEEIAINEEKEETTKEE